MGLGRSDSFGLLGGDAVVVVGAGLGAGELGEVGGEAVGGGGWVGRAEADEGGGDHDQEPDDEGDAADEHIHWINPFPALGRWQWATRPGHGVAE